MSSRRDRDEGLNTSILEDGEEHDEPESHREVLDRPDVERPALAGVPEPTRLVRDVVPYAQVAVEEEDGDRAEEGEERDDGRDPERPRVRAQVAGDDVRGRLACELREVRDAPDRA